MRTFRVELDSRRVNGRAEFFRHVGEGLFKRFIQSGKIASGEVIVPEGAYTEIAKAYYLLSDPYKTSSGITWTDDIKKAGLSLAAVMIVAPFQVPDGTSVSNRYVPRINELIAEAVACSIVNNDEFANRQFESKLHFYNALRLLARFDGLQEFLTDLATSGTRSGYMVQFSRQDWARISQSIQHGEMMTHFRVFARAPAPVAKPVLAPSSVLP